MTSVVYMMGGVWSLLLLTDTEFWNLPIQGHTLVESV